MEKLLNIKMSRAQWGTVLVIAGLAAVGGAALLETWGLKGRGVSPLSFVGTLVAVKLGLFAFWPAISPLRGKGQRALAETYLKLRHAYGKKPSSMALWNEHDPRLDLSLFSSNVPTFVLNHEQRFIDWNPAFDLVFGSAPGIKRGRHVRHWFALLDNFRRVPKRTDKLYGEGIIPITDRERATFLSPQFGRMVFTKIMTPVIDRGSGRIVGWTVVLNINSVNKRNEFFEQLFAVIARETKRIRFAAGYDGLFDAYAPRRALLDLHEKALGRAERVLDLGCGTGSLTVRLLGGGTRVTGVDADTHLLRRARDKVAPLGGTRLVRQDPDLLDKVPEGRYDGVAMVNLVHRLSEPAAALAEASRALKPGGILSLSAMLPSGGVDSLYNSLRTALELAGKYDNLKHQFNCVLELEREQAQAWVLRSREDLRAMVLEAGFSIDREETGLEDGHTLFLVARKA